MARIGSKLSVNGKEIGEVTSINYVDEEGNVICDAESGQVPMPDDSGQVHVQIKYDPDEAVIAELEEEVRPLFEGHDPGVIQAPIEDIEGFSGIQDEQEN